MVEMWSLKLFDPNTSIPQYLNRLDCLGNPSKTFLASATKSCGKYVLFIGISPNPAMNSFWNFRHLVVRPLGSCQRAASAIPALLHHQHSHLPSLNEDPPLPPLLPPAGVCKCQGPWQPGSQAPWQNLVGLCLDWFYPDFHITICLP